MVDDFVASMTHAAERAVAVAVDVLMDSIRQMTFTDVKNIFFSRQDDRPTNSSDARAKKLEREVSPDRSEIHH